MEVARQNPNKQGKIQLASKWLVIHLVWLKYCDDMKCKAHREFALYSFWPY